MVLLTGKNLGERHKELNNKVADFIANKKNFNEIKIEVEITDVDKLYKIDIASQYKDVDYIVDILKSGDSLYISRALKCLWLYNDSYSHVINVENLHVNVFPYMSVKMKKKMLSTISMHVRNHDRAASFFVYCKKHGLTDIALKFLNVSSEEFKLSILANKNLFNLYSYKDNEKKLQYFVGNSFVLATAYIEQNKIIGWPNKNILHDFRYLYAINNEKYLDIFEKYESNNLYKPNGLHRLGIRISKDIMLKHKNRVFEKPLFYVEKINKSMLAKYSSKCDAKKFINSLMPLHAILFWQMDFCTTYNYILDLVLINEKFEFMKQMFTTKYPGEAFELTIDFYKLKYYNMLSTDQKELWALRHIDGKKEILGSGNDYIWYKFLNVDKALIEIQKYVFITPDNNKRSDIVNILVESTRDQKDLIKVLHYYNDRHINENVEHKENFIDKVLSVHNVFEFNIECWEALNKILYSLELYTAGRFVTNKVIMAVAVACHILHNKDMPQALTDFVDLDVNYRWFSSLLEKLGNDKSEIVFQYLLKLFVDKLQPFDHDPYNKKLRKNLKTYVNNIYNILSCFQKDDTECPDIVKKFMDIHSPKPIEPRTVTAKDIFNFIKTDATLAVDILSHFDQNINDWPRRLNSSLRKLRVYFQNDVAVEYINFLYRWLPKFSENYYGHELIEAAIFAIFQLADESFKVTLMEKYYPIETKIDHGGINRNLLCIQEAICRFVGYSRPPVPLKNVLQYIKGDYVHYCLPLFNMYLVNLPVPLAIKFTESILNTPLSVQKHGLRLAFKCFTDENLKTLLLNTWKKTKNVSLRMIIYKSLFDKIMSSRNNAEDARTELYEALRFFTSDLHQDDHDDIFKLISSYRMSNKFIDDYLRTAWDMVIKLPKKPVNINRQTEIIRSIDRHINVVQRDFVRKRIIEEHIHEMLEQRVLRPDELREFDNLWNAKWELTASHIVRYSDREEMEQCLALMSVIFKKCVQMWDDRCEEIRIFRKFIFDFINYLQEKSYVLWYENPKKSFNVPIFRSILDMLQEALPLREIYLIIWDLKLTIFARMSLDDTDSVLYDRGDKLKPLSHDQILIISDTFANNIGHFVKELLVKHQFYTVFLPEIAELIKNKLQSLDMFLEQRNNFKIIFCESLANVGMKETHLLVLMILPTSEVPHKNLKRIFKIVQAFENEEVQSYLLKICGDRI